MMAETKAYSIIDTLSWATLQLEGGSLLNARGEAERIVGEAVGLSRAELYMSRGRFLAESEREFVEATIVLRLQGVPLQYIIGHQEFRYLDLFCRDGVLIPRSETELLVDSVLDELKSRHGGRQVVLDIGCGTGAIALSVAHEYSEALVYAVDVSPIALGLTRENARVCGLEKRVHVIQSNLFSGIANLKAQLDVVVSNPPYIPSREIAGLQREVQHEPKLALDGGADGLDFYRYIIERAPEFLKPGGALLFEVGAGQAGAVAALCCAQGFASVEVRRDYQQIERIVKAKRI